MHEVGNGKMTMESFCVKRDDDGDDDAMESEHEELDWTRTSNSDADYDRLIDKEYESMVRELEEARQGRETDIEDDLWNEDSIDALSDGGSSTITDVSFVSSAGERMHELRQITGQLFQHYERKNRRVMQAAKELRESVVLKEVELKEEDATDSRSLGDYNDCNDIELITADTLRQDLTCNDGSVEKDDEHRQREKEERRLKRRIEREMKRKQRIEREERERTEMKKRIEEERLAVQNQLEEEMKRKQQEAIQQSKQVEEERLRVLKEERSKMEQAHRSRLLHEEALHNRLIMQREEKRMKEYYASERNMIHESSVALQREENHMRMYLQEEKRRRQSEQERLMQRAISSMNHEEHLMRKYMAEEKRLIEEQKQMEKLKQKKLEQERLQQKRVRILEEQKRRFLEAEEYMESSEKEVRVHFTIAPHVKPASSEAIRIRNIQRHRVIDHLRDWQVEERHVAQSLDQVDIFEPQIAEPKSEATDDNREKKDGTILNRKLLELNYPEIMVLHPDSNHAQQLINVALKVENIVDIDREEVSPLLNWLQILSLDQNDLVSMTALPRLPKLRILSLSQNSITSFDGLFHSCGNGGHLMDLILEQNRIRQLEDSIIEDPKHIPILHGLRELNLRNNLIDGNSLSRPSAKNVLHFVPRLQSLNLFHNNISEDLRWHPPWIISQLRNILDLDIAENRIKSASLRQKIVLSNGSTKSITVFPKLQELSLFNNTLTGDVNSLQLSGNVLLRELLLSGNCFESITAPVQQHLPIFAPLLQTLKLDGCGIRTLYEHCFISLVNLTALDLSFNSIDNLRELKCLKWCHKLKKIKVNDNPVSEMPGYMEFLMTLVMPHNVNNLSEVDIDTDLMPSDQSTLRNWARYTQFFRMSLSPYLMFKFAFKLDELYSNNLQGHTAQSDSEKNPLSETSGTMSTMVDTVLSSRITLYRKATEHDRIASAFAAYRSLCNRQLTDVKLLMVAKNHFRHSRTKYSQHMHMKHVLDKEQWFERRHDQADLHYTEHLNFDLMLRTEGPSVRKNREYAVQHAKFIIRKWLTDRNRIILEKKHALRNASAIKIQAVFRGHLTRLRELGWILERLNRRHMAAIVIQKIFRGWFVRNILKKAKEHNERDMAEIDKMFQQRADLDLDEWEDHLHEGEATGFILDRKQHQSQERFEKDTTVIMEDNGNRKELDDIIYTKHHDLSMNQGSLWQKTDEGVHGDIGSTGIHGGYLPRLTPRDHVLNNDLSARNDPISFTGERFLLPQIRRNTPRSQSHSSSLDSSITSISDSSKPKLTARSSKHKANTNKNNEISQASPIPLEVDSFSDSSQNALVTSDQIRNKPNKSREEEIMKEWSITQERTAQSLMRRIDRMEKMKRTKEKRQRLEKNPQLRFELFKKRSRAAKSPKDTQKTIAASASKRYQNRQTMQMQYGAVHSVLDDDMADTFSTANRSLSSHSQEQQILFHKQQQRHQYRNAHDSNLTDQLELESVSSITKSFDGR